MAILISGGVWYWFTLIPVPKEAERYASQPIGWISPGWQMRGLSQSGKRRRFKSSADPLGNCRRTQKPGQGLWLFTRAG